MGMLMNVTKTGIRIKLMFYLVLSIILFIVGIVLAIIYGSWGWLFLSFIGLAWLLIILVQFHFLDKRLG